MYSKSVEVLSLNSPTHTNPSRTYLSEFTRPMHVVGNTFSCVCLSVCPVHALSFESLDLETLFLVCRYIFTISRSSWYIKVTGSRSRSQELKGVSMCPVCRWSVFDWKLIMFLYIVEFTNCLEFFRRSRWRSFSYQTALKPWLHVK